MQNFLELLLEHRMPVIFRIRRDFEELWAKENKQLDVTVTSAVELDVVVAGSAGRSRHRRDRRCSCRNRVDEEILGGTRYLSRHMVLDASLRNRLEKLRKNVAAAA